MDKWELQTLYRDDLYLGEGIEHSPLTRAIITEALEGGGADSIDGVAAPRPVAEALYRLATDIEAMADAICERYAVKPDVPGKALGCYGCDGTFTSADELERHEQETGHGPEDDSGRDKA